MTFSHTSSDSVFSFLKQVKSDSDSQGSGESDSQPARRHPAPSSQSVEDESSHKDDATGKVQSPSLASPSTGNT